MTFVEIILLYVCPSLGGIMSSIMFAAPVNDLRHALANGRLGYLNPFPFAMMSGNCLGWLIYGYFVRDPFLIAANLPGFILSIWLNMGAAKLQYLEIKESQKSSVLERHDVMERWNAHRVSEEDTERLFPPQSDARLGSLVSRQRRQEESEGVTLLQESSNQPEESVEITPQETLFLRVLVFWAIVLVYASWFYPQNSDPAPLVGFIVNLNLIAFYGAPLKTIRNVIAEENSASIHKDTMIMNWINTTFWIGYGSARRDLVVVIPNAIGLSLGMAQGVLCLLYSRHTGQTDARLSSGDLQADLRNPEEVIPDATAPEDEAKVQISANAPEVV